MESRHESGTQDEIEVLKKQKLAVKDELYALLQKISLTRIKT
ncbi:MAG TPA: YdcH family protein [Azonexus sp.]|nr:YdcH family protein [Azonexus sp.]